MKYVVYKEKKLVTGDKSRFYYSDTGYTPEQDKAKKFDVKNIIELVILILQLILKFGVTFKYEKIKG